MAKFADFVRGYGLGQRMVEDYEKGQERRKLAEIAQAQPEESQGFTAEQGQQLEQLAGTHDIAYDDGQQAYTATPKGGGTTSIIAQQGVTDFLGNRTAGKLAPGQVRSARLQAAGGILSRSDPAAGLKLEVMGEEVADREAKREKDARLARILAGRDPMTSDAATSVGSGTDFAGHMPGYGVQASRVTVIPPASTGQTLGSGELSVRGAIEKNNADGDLNNYLQRVVPGAVQEMVKQGRLEEAKRLAEFAESRQGQEYAKRWTAGVRRLAFGDYTGALSGFESLYNDSLGNGQRIKLTPGKDGKVYGAELFNADGNSLGAQELPVERLAATAATFLSPEKAVEHYATQSAQRDKEGALLDRQVELERLRQQGRDVAEDRRDERLAQQLAAQDARLDRRLAASGGGGRLSPAQQRGNLEIDAARRRVQGMSSDEIRRRTTPTTASGRENPDFDPGLARAAALARRRKIGDDDFFDLELDSGAPEGPPPGVGTRNADGSVSGKVPTSPASTAPLRQERAKRFRSDPAMNSYRLGRDTAQGVEVLDRNGKLVGYFD